MSNKISPTYFNVGGNPGRGVSATADFTTDAMDLRNFNGPYIVYVSRSLTTGNPRWTIEHSWDGNDWFEYDDASKNLTIPNDVRESVFYPAFMRINYEANGATGTVTLLLTRINQ